MPLLIPSTEAVSTLETHSNLQPDFSIKLPPARSIAKLWPQSENAIALPHGCQTTVHDRAQAFLLALELSNVRGLSSRFRSEVQLKLQRAVQQLRPKLENSKQWEPALHRLLFLPSNLAVLVYLLEAGEKLALPLNVQAQLANALVKALRNDCIAVKDRLLHLIFPLASDECFNALHEDLRIAITTIICRFHDLQDCPESIRALHEALRQDNVMTDSDLQASFQHLSIAETPADLLPRRRKRRGASPEDLEDAKVQLVQRLTKLMIGGESRDFASLPQIASNAYLALSEEEKCVAWQLLTDLTTFELGIAIQAVAKLTELPELHRSKRPRVLSMLAIRACVEKTADLAYLSISLSAFGQLTLRSLHSSLRDLRVAAGQSLMSFLRDDLQSELKAHNRKVAIEYMRTLADRDVPSEQDTMIAAWGQVALTCNDSELNLVLLRLVEYLGHSNPLICGLAFSSLEKVADAKGQSVDELFKPFWSSIAVSVVQDVNSKPQKAQQLCDLLRIDVNHLLLFTQQETVPGLVLTKKREVLQRIAVARGNGTTVQDLCLQPRTHLAAILVLLLAQSGADVEQSAMVCLVEVARGFRDTDLASLVKIDPTLIACYMLKYIGDQTDDRKPRAYRAFQAFANIAERRLGQAKVHSKSSRAVSELFESNILGIMTYFSEVLENTQGIYPKPEKVRCLRAIGEMINMNGRQVALALPQIRAALQSAMGQSGLCDYAFAAWLNLLRVLDDDDLAQLIDQTLALILWHWSDLTPGLQQSTHEQIGQLVKNHNKLIQDNIMLLPSLSGIPLLSKFGGEIERLKSQESIENRCKVFARRLRDENRIVVLRALQELPPFLHEHQAFVHDSAISEQPATVLLELLRALLDVTAKHTRESAEVADLCGKALGIIGCLDPNRVEAPRKKRRVLILSNFDKASEVIDWAVVLLEDILVKAFKSVTNARAQGFLAYVMQELLRFCGFIDATTARTRSSQAPSTFQQWMDMPEHVRIILTPFVQSRYVVTSNVSLNPPNRTYPGFSADLGHSSWLRSLVYDLMWKPKGDNAQMVFPLLARIIRGHDLAIASFMLPYTMLNVVLGGTVTEVKGITDELLAVLTCLPNSGAQQETVKLCSESVFNVLDYMSTWLQEKKKKLGETRAAAFRTGHSPNDFNEAKDMAQIATLERFLASIPADVIATQAVTCGSYARALFHWEQYIRQERPLIPSARPAQQISDDELLYDKLQDIYAQIDEPDGLEGISAHLPFLNEDQQAIQHAKAGRWTAAQAWYELQLSEDPRDVELEERLLGCLRATGRYAPLLRYADSFVNATSTTSDSEEVKARLLPAMVEAQWMTGDMVALKSRLQYTAEDPTDFNVGMANLLAEVDNQNQELVAERIASLRKLVTQSMTVARTSSVQTCHDDLKKLHVLQEVEMLSGADQATAETMIATLERRLSIVGSYVSDKEYMLGVRRAVMKSLPGTFDELKVGSSWLTTSKLARQVGNTENAYNSVLRAYDCGDKAAKLEEARLLWRDGHQRHAIQSLESAIASGVFEAVDVNMRMDESSRISDQSHKQSMLSAKAHLLLAKWLDASGQRQTKDMTDKYQFAARHFQRWEKGHYYLAKHYQKLLEAEKGLPKNKQGPTFLSGEMTRLVIENLLRSIPFGNKYWHQSIPKLLTLWFELGMETLHKASREDQCMFEGRLKALHICNKQVQKYFDRVPPYVYYAALPQMISRLTHPNSDIWRQLSSVLIRIVSTNPSQALWSLLAVVKATDRVRVERGTEIINRLKDPRFKPKSDEPGIDLRMMLGQGQKLSDGLLHACEAPVEQRASSVSLSRDLGFNHKLAPVKLVVPIEATLTASIPSGGTVETIRRHKAFVQDKITIQSFADEVLVLASLQRPRKLTARGSDGKLYGLLCKPKDDLRKDQRLMEFNGIINRALKRDAESSKRRLYIKTYAVTPLSEESGTIEWVEGIKPIRDILLNNYGRKGIKPQYNEIKNQLNEACSAPEHVHIFLEKVLGQFPPCLHEWFTEVYPEPDTWFAARLRYARTAAVMSMTGHVLGLGDRHGENILLEESTGGVFHVDFNCLFDKGLTFEKPELVPFRLTHNMIDAMGPYGHEGPFRKSSELTLRLLRQSKDTLMTVLETFLYDPTTDFVGKKKRTVQGVPDTPQEILDSVERKLKGFLRGENVPLGVEGYVDALIREATSPWNLAGMYIGWCAFL